MLEDVAATAAGRDELAIRHRSWAGSYVKLGDLEGAREHLEPALATVEATGHLWLAPAAHRPPWASSNTNPATPAGARAHFEQGRRRIGSTICLHAASVEARCHGAALDALERRVLQTASGMIATGIEQARKMGRLFSESLCRFSRLASISPRNSFGSTC